MAQLKGFFKKITGDNASYDQLAKQPILDAETKLNIFKESTSISIQAFENYIKYMTKSIDMQLSEKFQECKDLFKKYESKGEYLNPNISHLLGIVFGKLQEIQLDMQTEVNELSDSIQTNVLKPLNDYQRELAIVKENRKELKEAYDKIEEHRSSLQKAKKDADNAHKSTSQTSRLMHMNTDNSKKMSDLNKLEDKVQRIERELDEANSLANEKYDKYTEGLYKRIADESELTIFYLNYLKIQKRYHKQALRRLETLIPSVKESIHTYNKKPVFGCPLADYVNISNQNQVTLRTTANTDLQHVSPVIKKLIDGMCKQNVFNEEGIFRVAGSRIKMNCIMHAINAGYLDFLDTTNDFDVHCLAGVLKQYIRELPDSLLCNDMYDYWISAINTQPSNKVEFYKAILSKLPKTNYENLRYLIKFLSIIVENSEKTKMTSTNMGICFGVSLLSNNNGSSQNINNTSQLGSGSMSSIDHNHENSSSPPKYIDMSIATTVFDFLLTNHSELFPGDINFNLTNTSSLKSSGSIYHSSSNSSHSLNTKTVTSLNQQIQSLKNAESSSNLNINHNMINNSSSTPLFESNTPSSVASRHYLLNDSSINEHTPSIVSSMSHQFGMQQLNTTPQPQNIKLNNHSSFTETPQSNSINNLNRHVKQNSLDNRNTIGFDLVNNNQNNLDLTPSTSYVNNYVKTNQIVHQQTNFNNSMNDPVPASPKMRNKKQAPAPPPVAIPSAPASLNSSNPNIQYSSEQSTETAGSVSSTSNASESNSLGSRLSASLRNSNIDISSSPSTVTIEKPNQPPPNIPIRPPPIGFNMNSSYSDSQHQMPVPSIYTTDMSNDTARTSNNNNNLVKQANIGFTANSENLTKNILLTSSTTSSTSTCSSQENIIQSPPTTQSLAKQIQQLKPVVPRKPSGSSGLVAAHINKFQSLNNSDLSDPNINDSHLDNTAVAKSTNEITSL